MPRIAKAPNWARFRPAAAYVSRRHGSDTATPTLLGRLLVGDTEFTRTWELRSGELVAIAQVTVRITGTVPADTHEGTLALELSGPVGPVVLLVLPVTSDPGECKFSQAHRRVFRPAAVQRDSGNRL